MKPRAVWPVAPVARLPAGSGGHLAGLDEWRGVACLLVLFFHSGFSLGLGTWRIFGFTGVHLFFILSGYLISRPFFQAVRLERPMPDARRFYIRRLVRLYPAYLVVLVLATGVRIITRNHPPGPADLITHALLVFNYSARAQFFSILAVFWSLAIELQFYAFLPLAFWVARRASGHGPRRTAFLVLAFFLIVGPLSRLAEATFLPAPSPDLVQSQFRGLFSFLDLFGWGMVAACHEETLVSWLSGRGARALSLAAGALIVCLSLHWCAVSARGAWMSEGGPFFMAAFPEVLGAGIFLIFINILVFASRAPASVAVPFLSACGRISYSLYLSHMLVQVAIYRLAAGFAWWPSLGTHYFALGCVTLPPCLAAAALLYRSVEEPSLRLARRLT